jgi:thiol-disulfide isomerase/thioredoxin
MKILKEVLKTGLTLVILLVVLNYTGLIGSISSATQSAILKTGLLDAEVDVSRSEIFNYDFTIKDLAGNKFSFGQYKSKVVFVNLWATWCGPCRAEMAGIQKLYSSIASDSISFVMLSLDRDTDQEKVVKYVNTKGFTFPVYLPSGRLTEQLSVPSIPTTFVIGKDGRIVAKEVGTTNFNTDKFRKFLRQLNQEKL